MRLTIADINSIEKAKLESTTDIKIGGLQVRSLRWFKAELH